MLILDANDSMNKVPSYDDDSMTTTTRFDCAKRVALDMISDLMIQSKTNEVAVLVLKTKTTRHHFCEHDLGFSTKDNDDAIQVRFPFLTLRNVEAMAKRQVSIDRRPSSWDDLGNCEQRPTARNYEAIFAMESSRPSMLYIDGRWEISTNARMF